MTKTLGRLIHTSGLVVLLGAGMLASACGDAGSTTSTSTRGGAAGEGGMGGDCNGAGEQICNGICANTQTDASNCGQCGADCTALPNSEPGSATCVDGACVIDKCAAAYADCDKDPINGCETDTTGANNCGVCGTICAAPTPLCALDPSSGQYGCVSTCPTGTPTLCDNSCVDLQTNESNCGKCAAPCPDVMHGQPICTDGNCGFNCNAGFTSNGMACVDIDECATNTDNCDTNATCVNTPGSFGCLCNTGFSGNGVTCTDVNECALNTDNCDTNATCTNTPGSFTCTCNAGSIGNGTFCVDVNECAENTDNCDTNATCTNTPGSFTCMCNAGYSGNGVTCTDIDECALNTDNCNANATCTNTPGSFTCACNAGYTGNGVTCTDIDECTTGMNNCAAPASCVNTPGSYTCQCLPPGAMCSGVCTDLDTNNSNCGVCGTACTASQNCVNGTCVGTGSLQLTLVWNNPGDMDLHVITPNLDHIYYGNKGPDSTTDFGQLDVDDLLGTGPENIFWGAAYLPPIGTYQVCVVPYTISGSTTYTLTIKRSGHPDLILTGTKTTSNVSSVCDASSPNFVTSFTLP